MCASVNEELQAFENSNNNNNKTDTAMPILARLREKSALILLVPTMLAFCFLILIVPIYWELHTPLTTLSPL